MDLLFPDSGLVLMLGETMGIGISYRLFSNNYVPSLSTTLGDLVEASFAGYVAVPQTFADFSLNGVVSHQAYAIAPPIVFANSSGGSVDVYGYFVTDKSTGDLLAVALFDGAPVSIGPGGTYNVVPVWGAQSQLSS